MTDGNLNTHIRTLQETGYVSVTKSYRRNRRLTTLSLTPAGRKAFADYIALLEQIVRQTRATVEGGHDLRCAGPRSDTLSCKDERGSSTPRVPTEVIR